MPDRYGVDDYGVDDHALVAPAPSPGVLSEIGAQRQHQIERGYTTEHDDAHGIEHLVSWAGLYATRYTRDGLVKAAALLVAAVESMDRYRGCGCDPEPQPTDGPDYHADHAAWLRRNPEEAGGDK